jgi:hypothetical protein
MSEQRDAASDRAYLEADRDTPLDELPDHIHRLWVTAEWWIGEAERLRAKVAELENTVFQLSSAKAERDSEEEAERYREDCRSCDGDGWVCQHCDEPIYECECDDPVQVPCPDCEGTGVEQDE